MLATRQGALWSEKPGQSLLVHLLFLSLSLSCFLHPKPTAPLCAVSVFRTQHCGVPQEVQGGVGPCVSMVGKHEDRGPRVWSSRLPASMGGGQPLPLSSVVPQGTYALSFLPVLLARVSNFLFFGWKPDKEN